MFYIYWYEAVDKKMEELKKLKASMESDEEKKALVLIYARKWQRAQSISFSSELAHLLLITSPSSKTWVSGHRV